jgi:hypothetical protein
MHLNQVGVIEYRIRKLETVLEIIRDAEVCSRLYVKASLIRGIIERLMEGDVADSSLPAFVLLVARHHGQDLKFLRRVAKNALSPDIISN